MNSFGWRNASRELDKEYKKAEATMFNASILVLYRDYGFRKLRIERVLEKANAVFDECASSRQKSLVQMCDEQLGIELRNDFNESYKDTPYLSDEDWNSKKDQVLHKMTVLQQNCYLIRVRQKMKAWMFPQTMASVLLALHKKENWGAERVTEFASKVQAVREEFDNDIPSLKAAVLNKCGMEYEWREGRITLKGDE